MMNKIKLIMLFLHEYRLEDSEAAVKKFVRECTVQTILALILLIVVVFLGDLGFYTSVMICLLPAAIPYVLIKRLDSRIERIKLRLLLELPVFVNKLLLLLQAGQTLQSAMLRCADGYSEQDSHPFAKQMALVRTQLRHGFPFAQVVEDLARRCGTQEVTFFSSAVLMNYKRGGDELAASLRSLSRDLWEKRKTVVKTLGEEASAKMIFPLIVVFITVMVTVGAPALMQLNE